jgi:CubicO group peptidase (beta-lactamase class C family)
MFTAGAAGALRSGFFSLLLNPAEIRRLLAVVKLFEPDTIVENFRSMDRMFDTVPVSRGEDVWHLPEGSRISLPARFAFGGSILQTATFLDYTNTTGLIVLYDGHVVFEEYYCGETRATPHISWSVSKSFVSALVGIALAEGHIRNIMDPVTDYVPILKDSGYDNVPLKHVLQMSSGIRFNESYANFFSDINRMGRTLALRRSIADFIRSLRSARPSGTVLNYVSMDTQVLAMVLCEATGKSLAELTQEKLWKPAGMEADAYWLTDATGMELGFGCLNAVLRDYARFGLLYMNQGRRGETQIVPAHWVQESIAPDAPHLMPGDDVTSEAGLGYGYQWWVPPRSDGDYCAIGIYNQFIYVDPRRRVVIAKTSANAHYLEYETTSELQSIEFFRAIAASLECAQPTPTAA